MQKEIIALAETEQKELIERVRYYRDRIRDQEERLSNDRATLSQLTTRLNSVNEFLHEHT